MLYLIAAWSSWLARQSHKLKVVGSSPTAATYFLGSWQSWFIASVLKTEVSLKQGTVGSNPTLPAFKKSVSYYMRYVVLLALLLFVGCRDKNVKPQPKIEPPVSVEIPKVEEKDPEQLIIVENHRRGEKKKEVPVTLDKDGSWQIVYNGKYTDYGKDFVILDLFEFSKEDIAKCKFPIAYFSAHYEDWRPDKNLFGKKLNGISGWKGERYVQWDDLNNQNVMKLRLDLAVKKGFKGVDIDNIDGPSSVAYFSWLLREAKKRNLAVGMKNTVEHLNIFGEDVDFFFLLASSLEELTCYKKYNKPVVRMYYGRGAKTPSYIYEIRSGKNGNKF